LLSAPLSVPIVGGGFVVVSAVVLLFRQGLWWFPTRFCSVYVRSGSISFVSTYLVVVSSSSICPASIFSSVSVRSVFLWWCFNAAGGGAGVFGSRAVFPFHVWFCFTRSVSWVWFTRVFCLFDGLQLFCSRFPATSLVMLLFHPY
jgi:hypothetical protein